METGVRSRETEQKIVYLIKSLRLRKNPFIITYDYYTVQHHHEVYYDK